MARKAYRAVEEAVAYCVDKDVDMDPYMRVVYRKCMELKIDPLVAAAAFLRQNLGEIEVEVGEDEEERKPRRDGKSREDGGKRSGKNRRDQHETRHVRRSEEHSEGRKPSRTKQEKKAKKAKKEAKAAKKSEKNVKKSK